MKWFISRSLHIFDLARILQPYAYFSHSRTPLKMKATRVNKTSLTNSSGMALGQSVRGK